MRKFLLIILMFLSALTAQAQANNSDVVNTSNAQLDSIPYNKELVEDLTDAVENKDFSLFVFDHFVQDSLAIYSESTDSIIYTTTAEFVTFLNAIFQNTYMYSYELYLVEVEGTLVYKLNYYVIMQDDDEIALGLIILGFAENEDGKIDLVLGQ